jgi:hypothetical protein
VEEEKGEEELMFVMFTEKNEVVAMVVIVFVVRCLGFCFCRVLLTDNEL